ncbi:MAG TPA: hypothetical protein VM734_26005 [Kofleriaceae bacterium]|jgi:hypothetical protein|nr:hypothetical protein [Kofleriaceae bacterium]
MINRITYLVPLALLAVACTGDMETLDEPPLPEGNASGGEENTYDHPGTNIDPFELLDRLRAEGPPRYAARVHSCPKMKYDTIGNVLRSRGVDTASTAGASAGALYRGGDQALGAPNYAARQRESRELSTATASKLFDIFVQAAPEIITNMPNRAECTVAGVGTQMFNADNQCTADGIACLLGVPATASHLELCNLTVSRASDVDKGKRIAVATLLAAANTCE